MPFPAERALINADEVEKGLDQSNKTHTKKMLYSPSFPPPPSHQLSGSWSQPLRGGPDNLPPNW